jgi:hypothetical protein
MPTPTPAETAALDETGPLLRFAAERIPNLDPTLTLAIAQAQVDAHNSQWTPAASQNFWAAFNKLCLLIQPTTLDCLAASVKDIDWFSLTHFKRIRISLAERTSGRYLWALLIAILIALPLQLYVWSGSIELQKIQDSLDRLQHAVAPLSEDFTRLYHDAMPAKLGDPTPAWTSELNDRAVKLTQAAIDMDRDLDRLSYETSILQRVTTARVRLPPSLPNVKDPSWFPSYRHAVDRFGIVRLAAVQAQEEAALEIGIVLSFILPLLFGVIGAIAYVVRSISDEITESTFSRTAPIRHLMRVTLGALAGVVVGFFTNLSSLALSPLALAFLAGYGVEALFAMFDGFIAKFKA